MLPIHGETFNDTSYKNGLFRFNPKIANEIIKHMDQTIHHDSIHNPK
jgi:hypothetical protein